MAAYEIGPRGAKLIAVATLPVPFAVVVTILRFLARRKTKSVGPDDCAILVALVSYIGLWGTILATATIGHAGWNQKMLTLPQVEAFLKIFYAMQILYAFVGPAAKMSILLLYRRLFSVIKQVKWATFIVGFMVTGWSLGVLFSVVFQCLPVGSFWEVSKRDVCIDSWAFYWANGVSNLILDLIILCLPIPFIWRLQMSTQRKLMTTGVFSIGIFVCVVSVLRVAAVWDINVENITQTTLLANIWTSLEPGFSIVACCLPTILPLFLRERRSNVTPYRDSKVTKSSFWNSIRNHPRQQLSDSLSVDDLTRTSSQHELYAGPAATGKVSTRVGTTLANNSWDINSSNVSAPGIRRDVKISMERSLGV